MQLRNRSTAGVLSSLTSRISGWLLCLALAACASPAAPPEKPRTAALPEPVRGINMFVTSQLVPPVKPGGDAFLAPDPFKAGAFDEGADSDQQALTLHYMTDLRENLHLHFRKQGVLIQSFYAGARYTWDELRRDRLNYRLSAWPTRSTAPKAAAEAVDLRFALMHEQTGRVVWTHTVSDPFRFSVDRGYELPQWQRVAIVEGIAKELMALLQQDRVIQFAAL